MTLIFEDRSSYNPDVDPISRIALTVECQPGQLNSVVNFLSGVEKQAGVYHAAFDSVLVAPVASPVAVEEVIDELHVPEFEIEPVVEAPAIEPEPITEGEVHGQQPFQQPDHDTETADLGQGSLPNEGGTAEVGHSTASGELAGAAGESAIEGSVSGNT